MEERKVTAKKLIKFCTWLTEEERRDGTIQKYLHDIKDFQAWLGRRSVDKEMTTGWKADLISRGLRPATVNSMLAALNTFLQMEGWAECRVKPLRLQRRIFSDHERELDREEYLRLLETARARRDERMLLILETLCATGIRVSELAFITAEAVEKGRAEVDCKGKLRCILLPRKLQLALRRYCRQVGRRNGAVFLGREGRPISRTTVWRRMKALCAEACVDPRKVFPHNLRHLFARAFYAQGHDIAKLADVLGHASIETTRIYIMESGNEHLKLVNQLHLLL